MWVCACVTEFACCRLSCLLSRGGVPAEMDGQGQQRTACLGRTLYSRGVLPVNQRASRTQLSILLLCWLWLLVLVLRQGGGMQPHQTAATSSHQPRLDQTRQPVDPPPRPPRGPSTPFAVLLRAGAFLACASGLQAQTRGEANNSHVSTGGACSWERHDGRSTTSVWTRAQASGLTNGDQLSFAGRQRGRSCAPRFPCVPRQHVGTTADYRYVMCKTVGSEKEREAEVWRRGWWCVLCVSADSTPGHVLRELRRQCDSFIDSVDVRPAAQAR